MDAYDAFKKLSLGSKFNIKRFKSDAERFLLTKKPTKPKEEEIKLEPPDETEKPKRKRNDDSEKEEEELSTGVVTLLGKIVAGEDGSVIKQKKKKKIMTEEKLKSLEKSEINHFRNLHHITVFGSQTPDPIKSFQELSTDYGVKNDILENIKSSGYTEPTSIQMQAIPAMLKGRNVLACAPTGSGKTAAFLVPIIHKLEGPQKKGFRAIILNPTRELAKQTYRECLRLSEGRDFKIHVISNMNQALEKYGPKSSQKFDILITTPNRLVYLLQQDPPAISLKNVEWLVIDEADKLFEDGARSFRDQLVKISRACTNENLCQAMFSATNTHYVSKWCHQNMKKMINITIGLKNSAAELVDQELMFVGNEHGKLIAIRNLIKQGLTPPVLIFVQSKERAQELFNELIYDEIFVDAIHSDRTQTQRDNTVRSFREGKIWVLICTELMSRGIDFKGVNLVINYDLPTSVISYIHRIGRTGRAGRRGKAITFFTNEDRKHVRRIANVIRASGCEVSDYVLTIKKSGKKYKKQMERSAPKRNKISTGVKYKKKNIKLEIGQEKEIEETFEEKKKKRKKWSREHREKRLKQKMSLFKKNKTSDSKVKNSSKKTSKE